MTEFVFFGLAKVRFFGFRIEGYKNDRLNIRQIKIDGSRSATFPNPRAGTMPIKVPDPTNFPSGASPGYASCRIRLSGAWKDLHSKLQPMVNSQRVGSLGTGTRRWHMCCLTRGQSHRM